MKQSRRRTCRMAFVLAGLAICGATLLGAEGRSLDRNAFCRQFMASDSAEAYAAGLMDGVQAVEVSFRSDFYRLRKDGEAELAERSLFVANAIAELLAHAKGQGAAALAAQMKTTCGSDLEGAAQLHFLLALDGWRRSRGS